MGGTLGPGVGGAPVGAAVGGAEGHAEAAFATQPVVWSTQSQHAPHHGYEPPLSVSVQYDCDGAPGQPSGYEPPFIDCGNAQQSNAVGGGDGAGDGADEGGSEMLGVVVGWSNTSPCLTQRWSEYGASRT